MRGDFKEVHIIQKLNCRTRQTDLNATLQALLKPPNLRVFIGRRK
ncbi:hypothetical protein GBAR_LOCUS7260 [Geodia barretti]|uniref:Uncharacterized protein n=1 Tax=Geodia barretti TaxID=519541 RepID=A0AA35W8H6_GEOBA|nr:hypothetical protein GBAR_LOCUS7260 [Geodia barretti]